MLIPIRTWQNVTETTCAGKPGDLEVAAAFPAWLQPLQTNKLFTNNNQTGRRIKIHFVNENRENDPSRGLRSRKNGPCSKVSQGGLQLNRMHWLLSPHLQSQAVLKRQLIFSSYCVTISLPSGAIRANTSWLAIVLLG
jgi:hypothetical protein